MSDAKDAFARSSAARAWQAARDAQGNLDAILERLARIEVTVRSARYLRRCHYCGAPTLDVCCRNCWDLLDGDPLAPTRNARG